MQPCAMYYWQECLFFFNSLGANSVVGTVHARPSLLSYTLKSLLNLTSALQSEGAACATATHSQIQNPVWNVNIGNGCFLTSKILHQIQ